MGRFRRVFGWIVRPQALVGFIVACLCVSALGNMARSQQLPGSHSVQSPTINQAVVPAVNCEIKPCIALTFDDGPNPMVTPAVLEVLARQRVKASFFVLGMLVPGQEATVRRMHHDGHEIGNHSWSHPDLTKLTPEQAEEQIQSTQRVIASAGVPAPRVLRPPYGAVNDMLATHNHLSIIRWNVDPEDWRYRDASTLHAAILATARPGAIILLHDIYPTTLAALEPTIQTLSQSYQLVTASQLLELSPGDQGQFFARER
jgi:peptidoglycan/xylan/chitin deacetylase (PgdA/CDA1 family)